MPLPGKDTGPTTPGFLATTFRLCAGTQVLTEIYTSSPVRAIWRFFLLTVVCAILAAVVGTMVQRGAFERAGKALDEEIGAFVITPEKLSFQKDPDTPRRLKLPYIMLEYYPGHTFTSEDCNIGRTSDFGITILPGGLASWGSMTTLKGEDIFFSDLLPAPALYAQLVSGEQPAPNWEFYSGPGLAEVLGKEFTSPAAVPESAGKEESEKSSVMITGSQAARSALSLLTAVLLLGTFGRNIFQAGLIVLLVSLVQYLRASTLPKEIAYRNVLTIMVYSTFPAQIFATLFDAAGGGRYLSFQILFVIIFFVYQLFAFQAVIKKVCPQPERKDDDFDDSDF